MIKLAMSHAISQSTKLSFFEERMAETMGEAQYVPRRLALRGELGLKREEVVKLVGKLFTTRVDVNLCTFFPSDSRSRDPAQEGTNLRTSIEYARCAKLLLGQRANSKPFVPCGARIPGNQATNSGTE